MSDSSTLNDQQSSSVHPPSWCRTAEQQLERATQLWPGIILPEPPARFVPRTRTEALLLHVPDTFDNLWDKVVAPFGYHKWRGANVKADKRHLRLAPNKPEYADPVWLAFDPEHGKGESSLTFWGQPDLAGPEVFSALIQFPDWPMLWPLASLPNLSGYQLEHEGDWAYMPCLDRWDDVDWFVLADRNLDYSGPDRASPSARTVA